MSVSHKLNAFNSNDKYTVKPKIRFIHKCTFSALEVNKIAKEL